MKQTKTSAYLLRALSNMHVGSGDNNYGIVDKQVQRDVITEFPTIHSSGLKGAFRELFESSLNPKAEKEETKKTNDELKEKIAYIFGSEKKDTKEEEQEQDAKNKKVKKFKAGNYHFFNAKLLAIPVRCNQQPFYSATSKNLLTDFVEQLHLFNHSSAKKYEDAIKILNEIKVDASEPVHFTGATDLVLEDYAAKAEKLVNDEHYKSLQELLGERFALFAHADLKRIIKDLPIIARNNLENGESVNLWYEEVVPRESRFYFLIKYYQNGNDKNLFEDEIEEHSNICQIGGNASVGYGYSSIINL